MGFVPLEKRLQRDPWNLPLCGPAPTPTPTPIPQQASGPAQSELGGGEDSQVHLGHATNMVGCVSDLKWSRSSHLREVAKKPWHLPAFFSRAEGRRLRGGGRHRGDRLR